MPERALPIAADAAAHGLSLRCCGVLVQYHGWPDTYDALASKIAAQCGAANAPVPGKAVHGSGGALLRVHPQRLWLLAEGAGTAGSLAVDPQLGAALDLSHARAIVRIEGDQAEPLLSRFIAIDLRPHRFAVDDVAITPLHRVSVVLWRRPAGIDLLVPRSFARSTWELLMDSASLG